MNRWLYTSFFLLISCNFFSVSAYNSPGTGISDDESLVTFAKQIEESIESRNPYYFNLSFNSNIILDQILGTFDSSLDSTFDRGFSDGLQTSFDLGAMIIDELGNEGTYTFITAYHKNNDSWIVFRLISENGINYHEFKVENIDDNFQITDGYFYLSGEKLSETLRLIYERNAAIYLQHTDVDKEWLQALNDLDKIKLSYSNAKFSKAYKSWQKTPAVYRKTKAFQYTGLNIAVGLDQESFLKMYNEYLEYYPSEPAKYFIPLNALVSHGYYDLALQCLDSLNTVLVADPLLDFFRAKIYFVKEDLDKSVAYLSIVINALPDFEMGYLSLLNIYLTEKKYEEATGLLDQMMMTFNTYKQDFYPYLTDYPEYLNSSIFKEWIEQ